MCRLRALISLCVLFILSKSSARHHLLGVFFKQQSFVSRPEEHDSFTPLQAQTFVSGLK